MLNRYVAAFESYDVDQLVALLRDDATFSMPPYDLWLQGPGIRPLLAFGNGIGLPGFSPSDNCGMRIAGFWSIQGRP